MLATNSPESVGLDPRGWQFVLDLVGGWCDSDRLPAAGLVVGRAERTTGVHLFGRQRIDGDPVPIRDDAIFLIASITKPIVATGLLLLLERAQIALGDRVCDFIPEFGRKGKRGITIRHLLTHTSGLPDMLPTNRRLRVAHSGLDAFVEQTCAIRLDFPPGRGVQYQSMGFAILGALIHRVSGKLCADFLRDELFTPLGMHDTQLGAPEEWFTGEQPACDRIAEIRVSDQQQKNDWNWNSRYWRGLGAPWGGLLTTPSDLAKFAQMMLRKGTVGDTRLLSRAAVEAATRNQLAKMRDVSGKKRRCQPWGLGWRLQWPAHSANFGDLLGPRTFGHWGSTGTVLWIDPQRDAFAVVLTTQPQEPSGYYLARVSNAIAAALV